MAGPSKIGWTNYVWNYWSGCSKVSPGCAHCYAEATAERWAGGPAFPNGFAYTLRPHLREWPLTISAATTARKYGGRARIFVNSMSDVFLEEVPDEHVHELFDTMRRAHWHDFLVLTKRHERMLEMAPSLPWPPNVWMGVSVENQRFVERAEYLARVPAAVRFLSVEPLLGPVNLDGVLWLDELPWGPEAECGGRKVEADAIDWVIIGGESGSKARRMDPSWARSLLGQCRVADVPVFVKQTGSVLAREWGLGHSKGETLEEWPEDFRVQEFPGVRRAA